MGNTVGSRESLIAFKARKQQILWVQPHQLEILCGSILGDAYVAPLGKIQLEHSVKQLEYLMWKYDQLATISYAGKPAIVKRYNRRVNKSYKSIRFWTRQFFRPLRNQFYQGKTKIFPRDLTLTPLMMAVWHMDDGHYDQIKDRVTLATDAFDSVSLTAICKALKRDFAIHPMVRPSGKLVIVKESQERFFSAIRPFIIPSMRYKIR